MSSKLLIMARAALKRKAAKAELAPMSVSGENYRISDKELLILIGLNSLVNGGVTLPANLKWRTDNGTEVTITAIKLKNILIKALTERHRLNKEAWDTDPAAMDYDDLITLIREN